MVPVGVVVRLVSARRIVLTFLAKARKAKEVAAGNVVKMATLRSLARIQEGAEEKTRAKELAKAKARKARARKAKEVAVGNVEKKATLRALARIQVKAKEKVKNTAKECPKRIVNWTRCCLTPSIVLE